MKVPRGCLPLTLVTLLVLAALLLGALGGTSFHLLRALQGPTLTVDIRRELWDNTEFVKRLANLELAERQTTETIIQTETSTLKLPLVGELAPQSRAIFELRFKALYTYCVSADRDGWKFSLADNVAQVRAPALRPRPPVVFTDSVAARYEGGWLVFDEKGKLEALKAELSSVAAKRAGRPRNVELVREQARLSLEGFIRQWFLKDRPEVKQVKVRFADEVETRK